MSADTTALGGVSCVRVVGGVLPADVVGRAMAGGLPGMAPQDYHLAGGERVAAAAARSWEYLLGAYTAFRVAEDEVPAGQTATAVTREKWLLVLLRELGYGRVPVTPGGHLLAGEAADAREYPVSHLWGDVPMHLLGWRVDLDRRTEGVAGAARAPQAMVQELLNRSEEHLWAVLSNGRVLRLLRDSSALVGQSYLEFDLEAMFDGELFSDFVALFLLCHESRLERLPDDQGRPGGVADRWLERWRSNAIETGTRALTALRGGVEQALEVLGTGFLRHPGNTVLRERLASGEIGPADLQRSLLRTVYRLLFWFVTEDRGLLLDPAAAETSRQRYARFFSSARLRRLAARSPGGRHHDLWQQTELVLDGLGAGVPHLGLPGLGGLFTDTPLDVTGGSQLGNAALLRAVRLLSTTTDRTGLRAVDFHHLGAEELGGIYEGLLELHPRIDPGAGTFTLERAAGNERKTTGSYYTPSDLIALVLDEALDPVLAEAGRAADPDAALLGITVCDPACGSGHFLVAAARRIAVRLAAVRSGESEPTPAMVQAALRDVVGRCIHGVDLNPMAAELAKVSLWLEAVEPGRPLAFLDANIRVGNALLGTTPALLAAGVPDEAFKALTGDDKAVAAALRKRNKGEREAADQGDLFAAAGIPVANADLAVRLTEITADARRAGPAEQHFAAARLAAFESSPQRRRAIGVADAWCAAFTQPKTKGTAAIAVTDKVVRDWATGDAERPAVAHATAELVAAEAARHRFFHWHLEYPQIFEVPESGATSPHGWNGGFTVMVGNPPWERVKLQEKEFFDDVPQIASAPNAAARKKLIKALPDTDPVLWDSWVDATRAAEATSEFLRNSGRFPLTGAGDVNTYQVFAETFRDFIAFDGRCGFITPTGLATDATTAPFFADTLRTRRLAAFYDFENEAKIFAGVDHRVRFAMSVMTGGARVARPRFAFLVRHVEDVPARRFDLGSDEALLLNPNTGTLPVFRSRADAEITTGIYHRYPVLIRTDPAQNPWGLSFRTLFHMANDSGLFRTEADLAGRGAAFDGWGWLADHTDATARRWLPLYEAKLLSHYDHRLSTYRDATQAQLNVGSLPRLTAAQHDDPSIEPLARYWVEQREVDAAIGERTDRDWLFGWRDITNVTNERTMVPSVLPRSAVGDAFLLAYPSDPRLTPLLQCAWSSLAFDYVTRQKQSGTHLKFYTLKQVACPTPAAFAAAPPWLDRPLRDWVVPRVLELTYTSYRIGGYARDMGDEGEPFRWIPERRFAIQRELDAAMMHVYGLAREEAEHVLDSFPVLRKYEEAPPEKNGFGEFRTQRMVLEFYDSMARAAAAGTPYCTPIDPPPGRGPRHTARG